MDCSPESLWPEVVRDQHGSPSLNRFVIQRWAPRNSNLRTLMGTIHRCESSRKWPKSPSRDRKALCQGRTSAVRKSSKCQGTTPSALQVAEVSGHDFSRAAYGLKIVAGFSP